MEQIFIVLLCVGLIRFSSVRNHLPAVAWLPQYLDRIPGTLIGKNKAMNFLFVFGIPFIAFWLVFGLLSIDTLASGFVGALVAFLVLFYSVTTLSTISDSDGSLRKKIQLFHRHVFAPIFWFILFGAPGVFTYTLLQLIRAEAKNGNSACDSVADVAQSILRFSDWLSIRVLTIIFTPAGQLPKGIALWLKFLPKGPASNDELLEQASNQSLGINSGEVVETNKVFLRYMDSVLVNSVIVISIFALGYLFADGS